MNINFFPTSSGLVGYFKRKRVFVYVNQNGRKEVDSSKTKNFIMINFPLLRGILFFILGVIAFLSSFFHILKEKAEDSFLEKLSKNIKISKTALVYASLIVVSLGISILFLGYIPSKLSFFLMGLSKKFILRNFLIAFIKCSLIYLMFLALRFIPGMQELYKFNGAGNVALKNKGQIKDNNKYSHHSPLNFLNFFVFSFILSTFVITLVGISISFWLNWLLNLAIFLACISVSYEILWFISKNDKLEKLALVTSFLIAMKPGVTHDEVARVAYSQLNMKKISGEKVENDKIALATVLTEMQTKLSKTGKYNKSDVEWIIATVLGKNRAEAKLVRSFDEKTYREIMKITNERASGKPLSAIFGFVDFYGLRFNVNKKVLAPRMETEILVEEVLNKVNKIKKCEVLDVGTGSGAISVCVAKYGNCKVTAVDISKGALEVAKQNAKNNEVKISFLESNLFSGLKKNKKFDIIVSNPPYIRSLDIDLLDEEVKNYDPRLALDGGKDGLDFYRRLAEESKLHFKKNGVIFLEIGKGQFTSVKKILEKNGFLEIEGIKDYSKIYRVVKAKYGNN